jgi:hypothetical protein
MWCHNISRDGTERWAASLGVLAASLNVLREIQKFVAPPRSRTNLVNPLSYDVAE